MTKRAKGKLLAAGCWLLGVGGEPNVIGLAPALVTLNNAFWSRAYIRRTARLSFQTDSRFQAKARMAAVTSRGELRCGQWPVAFKTFIVLSGMALWT